MRRIVQFLLLLAVVTPEAAAQQLTVLKAGPVGEVAQLAEANEVRIVFSEPMVALGKIPKDSTPSWFRITPPVEGTFRWAGTTTLIFSPSRPLPFASRFDVTIDSSATAVSGRKLDRTYSFSFTTPTIQLRRVDWYRKGGRHDGPVVVALRFNQPVESASILAHLQLRTKGHEFKNPVKPDRLLEKREPQALLAFEAKRKAAAAAASSNGVAVFSGLAVDWDKKRFPPARDLVVLETQPNVAPETWLQVYLDEKLARGPQNVRAGRAQEFTVMLQPAFFVDRIECTQRCSPESWNPVHFRVPVRFSALVKALTVRDITNPKNETVVEPKTPDNQMDPVQEVFSLDELGYSPEPAHTYEIRIDSSLRAENGEPLGYTFAGVVEYWHEAAFTSFGGGHGVWEADGGPLLPFHARNFRTVKQWVKALSIDELMPALVQLEHNDFSDAPSGTPQERRLSVVPDQIQSHGLDIAPALGSNGKGLLWAAIREGEPIPRARTYGRNLTRATVVQVTDLGISVKDSPQNTLILVTRLKDAMPVAGAKVSIRDRQNKTVWSGVTDAAGLAIAPNTNLRRVPPPDRKPPAPGEMREEEEWESTWSALGKLHFVVIAEKEGDIAYAASNWHDGISPWDFGTNFDLAESLPLLRGSVFTDRGVYKPGEEVHAKAIVRSDEPAGMRLLPAGTSVQVVLRDSHDQEVEKKTVRLNEWSSSEWTTRIPPDRPLGNYRFIATVEGRRLNVTGEFLVAAYRRPDFRVDVALGAPSSIAGTRLDGTISGRYLFGAPMQGQSVKWTYAKRPLFDVPARIRNRFPDERFVFLGWDDTLERSWATISSDEEKLGAKGELKKSLETERKAGWPYEYRLEGEVTDVSRQRIANRTSFRVDPAPWYVGLKAPSVFADATRGIDTEVVTAALDGSVVPGVRVHLTLTQIQWNSVRRAEGNGFYTWETERKEVPSGEWDVVTQTQPVPFHVNVPRGGFYHLVATAGDGEGRLTTTRLSFYALGGGYTAWERYDHNRIDLVPEKKRYRPGETARIFIKSPWERATALVTTERESVRSWRQFELTSTQQTISIPISEADIPNVFVSVLLLKGRTKEPETRDESDPGKPSFRLGYVELDVEDRTKRLAVDVKANRDEYRPASRARIDVAVRDAAGSGAQSEVTLWAVDYGVLSLTAYQTPEIVDDIYIRKALQVVTQDSREKIISRRVITPKGAPDGGGGGADAGPGVLRKDFRVLAFWVGSIVTDRRGRARTEVTLPESLTTYRIMAVAGDKQSRFGWGESEIRISKPLLLAPAFPRFLAVGDKALFGAVVHSRLKGSGNATVTIRSLDPDILTFEGEGRQSVRVDASRPAEARFPATAKAAGTARIQMTVASGGERDAFEETIPVRILLAPETVAAYGQARPSARETVRLPSEVAPGFGGLRVEAASTAMVGLAEGARYLVKYPYGCVEQRASATMALMLDAELGGAFKVGGADSAAGRQAAQSALDELKTFQCGDGGFAFWPGGCHSRSPYLTAYVLHVYRRAKRLEYRVDDAMLARSYEYLERSLGEKRPENEGWLPAYTAWQSFAVKVLAEGGRRPDSHINRLISYVDRMPLFGISYLADALVARGEKSKRSEDLKRRLTNAISPEAGRAHVEELADPHLLWFWNSNVRSTAIVMGTLVRIGEDEQLVTQMVRWLMSVQKDGRWSNTQENAWAMESLVDYYRKYESEVPDFTAIVSLGNQTLLRETFKGRSTEARTRDLSMRELLSAAPAGADLPLTFNREGTGTLFYMTTLRYASTAFLTDSLDQGFRLERSYRLEGGGATATAFNAGDLIRVTLRVRITKERRFVAVTDPIPAGTEPVEAWFATTATELVERLEGRDRSGDDWTSWWRRGGFEHVERHDDRVNVFATRLGEGMHEYSYLLRATSAGTFVTAPLHAEEMYQPEVFGRTGHVRVEIRP
ncbi:MAG TPA: MG2 domain-containing protein [Thermoanaerobaculia bacterium]|nr:MG2 domain-containing protein [Thermoanaerobaculia bacterium]